MPVSLIKSYAKKSGKSEKEVEVLWEKAKVIAKKEGKENNYAYINGTLQKMLGLEEAKMTFSDHVSNST